MKYLLPLVLLAAWLQAPAQTYYQVSHTTGTQTIGSRDVTVVPNTFAATYSGSNCGLSGPNYWIGNGTVNLCTGYKYIFNSPVNHFRLKMWAQNQGEVITFYLNSSKYFLTGGNLSTFPGTCTPAHSGTLVVVNGNLEVNTQAAKGQVDIIVPFAVDSIQTLHSEYGGGSYNGTVHDFAFAAVFDFSITQPFNDTIKCPGDSLYLALTTGTAFSTSNIFTAQLSNASGSFTNAVNIGTLNSSTGGNIPCKLPLNTPLGNGYRIRIVSSIPSQISADNGKNILITDQLPTKPVAGSNGPVCEGTSLSLSTSNTVTGAIYAWTGPATFTANTQNPIITSTTISHSGDYVVTAARNGCSAKDTVSVLIKPIPAIPTAGSNSPLCSGNSLNLSANSTTAGVSYSWNGPLSFTSTTQNPSIASTTPSMSGTYSVAATLNGCTSAAGTTVATVNLTPATPLATSNTPVCAGGAINLSANSSTPGVTYNWTGPNGYTANTQNPTITPVPLNGSGTYNVTAELNGCTSASGSTNVVVNNVSSLGVYPSPNDTLCINNANANFTAVPFNAGTAPQYQWYKNNNLIGGATNITFPASGIADGDSFYCRMTVTGLCADPLVLYSNKVGMTVLPLTAGPTVSVTADPGTLLSPWQLVKFTAVATNAGTLPKYQWKRNGQDVIGATSNVWSANNLSNNDTISCVVTSDVWCASPASEASNRMVVNIKTGISDIGADRNLELYPNPNNGSFIVYLPLAPSRGGHVRVDVIDAVGRIVYTDQQSQLINHQLKIQLPASVANGVYMLKLGVAGAVYHTRFTVSR